jgi:C4-dicarboxylate-specific signal transduction histidine kinase
MAVEPDARAAGANGGSEPEPPGAENLLLEVEQLRARVQQAEERRRALLHIMGDLHDSNRRLGDQRKAMLHILKDSNEANLRLADSRKAMIHIMGDLRETTQEMERREHELRDKQEQLIQAGKLATLGELTTGVAHELNNPLNNIGLYVGNVIDQVRLGELDNGRLVGDLEKAMEQVRKATEIISHLRTFGRVAPVSLEPVDVDEVIARSLSLMQEQLKIREIEVDFELCREELIVLGNPIQLEQVFINLLTNARDALADARTKRVRIVTKRQGDRICVSVSDTGPGIPRKLEARVFDPFFTTKEVGSGTGLGLSITYSIVKELGGEISVSSQQRRGATFEISLPVAERPANGRSS